MQALKRRQRNARVRQLLLLLKSNEKNSWSFLRSEGVAWNENGSKDKARKGTNENATKAGRNENTTGKTSARAQRGEKSKHVAEYPS